MQQPWKLSAHKLGGIFAGSLVVTNALVALAYLTNLWPFKILLFVSICFLPGVALLRAMRIIVKVFSVGVLYSFGLSLLVLMLSGLATNQILYIFGVDRPLQLPGILAMWDAVTAIVIAASVYINRQPVRFKRPAEKFSSAAWLLLLGSLLLPCLAVLGAFSLNNGGSAILAELTLVACAGLVTYAFLLRRHLPNELLAWLIFTIGLAILLMTSMRGWDIVGHDIEREFRVYTLTHMHAHWDIALNRDPYNACLSITILPEMFAKLLNISGLLVFKVILQVIFAACPVVVYTLLRRYISKLGALVGAMLFICYPTFITNSAMLTRQGVAYLFFALALLVVSNTAQRKRYKLLFSLCSLGAVLSHYSTAYMFVSLFAAAVCCKLGITWWQRHRHWPPRHRMKKTVLSPMFALLLLGMTFGWYTWLTATSTGLVLTMRSSVANISKVFSEDNAKSSDTSAALIMSGNKTQADLYQTYLTNTVPTNGDPDTSTFVASLTTDDLPLTHLGKRVRQTGLNPTVIMSLRQNFAKVLQLLALGGVLYVALGLLRRRPNALEPDFVCLNMAVLLLLALMVVLPVLSINYGILRAFQQALIFLLLPIMVLLVRIGHFLRPRLRNAIATSGVIALFLLFTGLFAQLLGGVSPMLSLANSGLYYGLYYSPPADMQSFVWLKHNVAKGSDVRAANFNRAIMHDPGYPFTKTGILPSQINDSSYVYLDPAQVQSQRFYAYYDSSPLIMTFPLDYYDTAKNQIYSTTSTRVYR